MLTPRSPRPLICLLSKTTTPRRQMRIQVGGAGPKSVEWTDTPLADMAVVSPAEAVARFRPIDMLRKALLESNTPKPARKRNAGKEPRYVPPFSSEGSIGPETSLTIAFKLRQQISLCSSTEELQSLIRTNTRDIASTRAIGQLQPEVIEALYRLSDDRIRSPPAVLLMLLNMFVSRLEAKALHVQDGLLICGLHLSLSALSFPAISNYGRHLNNRSVRLEELAIERALDYLLQADITQSSRLPGESVLSSSQMQQALQLVLTGSPNLLPEALRHFIAFGLEGYETGEKHSDQWLLLQAKFGREDPFLELWSNHIRLRNRNLSVTTEEDRAKWVVLVSRLIVQTMARKQSNMAAQFYQDAKIPFPDLELEAQYALLPHLDQKLFSESDLTPLVEDFLTKQLENMESKMNLRWIPGEDESSGKHTSFTAFNIAPPGVNVTTAPPVTIGHAYHYSEMWQDIPPEQMVTLDIEERAAEDSFSMDQSEEHPSR